MRERAGRRVQVCPLIRSSHNWIAQPLWKTSVSHWEYPDARLLHCELKYVRLRTRMCEAARKIKLIGAVVGRDWLLLINNQQPGRFHVGTQFARSDWSLIPELAPPGRTGSVNAYHSVVAGTVPIQPLPLRSVFGGLYDDGS